MQAGGGWQGRKQTVDIKARHLCLLSIEKNISINLLIPDIKDRSEAFGKPNSAERKSATRYRNNQAKSRKDRPRTYVATCIKHKVPIRIDDIFLRAIEKELLEQHPSAEAEDQEQHPASEAEKTSPNMVRGGNKNDDLDYSEDQGILDELFAQEKATSTAPSRAPRRSNRPSGNKAIPGAAGYATLMDREKTKVPVDLVIEADLDRPWMTILGCLFSAIPGVIYDDGVSRHRMSVYELVSVSSDPRDGNLRNVQVVDDGDALLYKVEAISQYTLDDPDSLVTKASIVEKPDVMSGKPTSSWAWSIRCDKAQDEYTALMTKLNDPQKKELGTVNIKINLPETVTADFINPQHSNGTLDKDWNLVNHEIEMKGQPMTLHILNLVWRAAIVSSIETIARDDSVEDICEGMAAMMASPSRQKPRKSQKK
jgi:hypothetical protein